MSDRLTSLPTELLEHICTYVCDPCVPSAFPLVCRTFVPFARRERFKTTLAHGSTPLNRLCWLLEASPIVAVYVKRLEIDFLRFDNGTPSNCAVLELFQRLANVTTRVINGSTRVVEALLSNPPSSGILPSLSELILRGSFKEWPSPFAPHHFYGLSHFKQLFRIELDVPRKAKTMTRLRPRREVLRFDSRYPWDVTIRGSGGSLSESGVFLYAVEEVRSLALHDSSATTDESVVKLLDCLGRPSSLTMLSFNCAFSVSAQEKLATALPKLFGLEVLQRCTLPAAGIKALLDNPRSCTSLSTLTLLDVDIVNSHLDGTDSLSGGFTEADMREIVELGEARDVEVCGRAADWVRRRRRERAEAAEREMREKQVKEAILVEV
ncbi:hypothetical protein JCM8097_008074 [Rhodosporidiobolus ruineniae]